MAKKKSQKQGKSHDCCHKDASEAKGSTVEKKPLNRKTSYISGIVAGLLACLCCCLPIVALAIGVATISNVAWLEVYHTEIEILGWLIMLAAVFYMWTKHRQSGISILKDKHFWVPLICMIVVYTSMTYIIQKFLAPAFPEVAGHQH